MIQLTKPCDEQLLKIGSTLVILTKPKENHNQIKIEHIKIEKAEDKTKFDINTKDKLFFIEKCESDQKECYDEKCKLEVSETCIELNESKKKCQTDEDARKTNYIYSNYIPPDAIYQNDPNVPYYGIHYGGKKSRRKRQNRKTKKSKRKRRRSIAKQTSNK